MTTATGSISQAGQAPRPSPAHPEVVIVTTRKVSCDGDGGALGHPKVWYDMAEHDYVECKYCDRVFALKGGSHDPS